MKNSLSIEMGDVGFCGGVERADNLIKKIREEERDPIYVLGELIHNASYNENLKAQNIFSIHQIEEAKDKIVIIRTHGISPEDEKKLYTIAKKVYDLTCPLVKTIQDKAQIYSDKGYFIIIIGNEEHAETIGIKGYTFQSIVIQSLKDVENLNLIGKEKVVALSQSTFSQDKFIEIIDALKKLKKDIEIDNTLCYAPTNRQDEMFTLAKQNDMILVIGGKNSSNTHKLYEKALKESLTKKVYRVENIKDVYSLNFEEVYSVGIASGTSTPTEIIEEITDFLKTIELRPQSQVMEKN